MNFAEKEKTTAAQSIAMWQLQTNLWNFGALKPSTATYFDEKRRPKEKKLVN